MEASNKVGRLGLRASPIPGIGVGCWYERPPGRMPPRDDMMGAVRKMSGGNLTSVDEKLQSYLDDVVDTLHGALKRFPEELMDFMIRKTRQNKELKQTSART